MAADVSTSVPSLCGYTLVDAEGDEYPCDKPATGWRWYQDVEHEDCLSAACADHETEGGRRLHTAEAEVERLTAALAAARPVITSPAARDDLPVGVVVRSAGGTIACRLDTQRGVVFGVGEPFPWRALQGPLTVLYGLGDDHE